MKRRTRFLHLVLSSTFALGLAVPLWAAQFPVARIYIEYNATDDDLGFHVFLDAEDWNRVAIASPAGETIFEVEGRGAYGELGLTELFFEGAEPSLADVPLDELLARMPEGAYTFQGVTVDGRTLKSRATLSHAVPAGPEVSVSVSGSEVVIAWEPVTGTPEGFPDRRIEIVGYQVIVGSFQITLPASSTSVEVPEELIEALGAGEHEFEVLAIDASGNQTITAGGFETE